MPTWQFNLNTESRVLCSSPAPLPFSYAMLWAMFPSNLVPLQPYHRNHLRHRLNRLPSAPHPHATCEPPALPQTGEGGSTPIGLLGRGVGDVRNVLRHAWREGGEQPGPLHSSGFLVTNSGELCAGAMVRVPTERALSATSGTCAIGSPPLLYSLWQ